MQCKHIAVSFGQTVSYGQTVTYGQRTGLLHTWFGKNAGRWNMIRIPQSAHLLVLQTYEYLIIIEVSKYAALRHLTWYLLQLECEYKENYLFINTVSFYLFHERPGLPFTVNKDITELWRFICLTSLFLLKTIMTNNSVLQKFFLVYKLEIWETAKELHAYIYSVQKRKKMIQISNLLFAQSKLS